MGGAGMVLLIIGVVLWVSGVLVLWVAWRLKMLADLMAKRSEESLVKATEESKRLIANAELEVKWRTNQISMLGPDELYLYIAHRFNMCLETAARTDIATGEWHIETKLFEKAYMRLAVDDNDTGITAAFGPDTVDAINARYGKTYLSRTCEQYFRWLMARSAIPRLINREIGVAELDRMADGGMPRKDK